MLELIGRGYAIEHCVSFLHKKHEDEAFRIYLTDAIRMITYNTALKGRGVMEQRFFDIIKDIRDKSQGKKEQTAEEVITHISDKLRSMNRS